MHIYFPPKNSGETLPNATSLLTAEYLRSRADYRAYFVRRNTIPVDIKGNVFSEYRYKMFEMMRGLDANDEADARISNLGYETWI